jgi:endoglycosylceramidase
MRSLSLSCVAASLACSAGIVVDHGTSALKDESGRQRLWHGVNFVEKSTPFYPTITDDDMDTMRSMGFNVVRLGVMVSGLFEQGPQQNATYLDNIEAIIDRLHAGGFDTILDLHQDVLAPKLCGEGTPDWMLNMSSLNAMAMPRPLTLAPIDIDPVTGHPVSCAALGPLKFIGWSEWKLTDACGKAYQQLYDGVGPMAEKFAEHWQTVATRFKGHPGVIAYELMNEPWVGDHVSNPHLLLKSEGEGSGIAKYMQKMHDIVREVDPDTLVLYASSEVTDLLMRRVGYESGWLPEAALAWHAYCIIGTDGDGPTTPLLQAFCHVDDELAMKQREKDLRRLQTAGFVTEFGAVNPSETGLTEVGFVLERLEAMSPPSSWAFWDFSEIIHHSNATQVEAYKRLLARPFPRALAGEIVHLRFNQASSVFHLEYEATEGGVTEIVVPRERRYSSGFDVAVTPEGALSVEDTEYGLKLTATAGQHVTIELTASKAPAPDAVV